MLVLLAALAGCDGDKASAPEPAATSPAVTSPAAPTSTTASEHAPSFPLQRGLLARLAADPKVIKEMIGRQPRGVVLCGIDLLGHSEGERYAWLFCGDYRTGPDAGLLSASAEPVVIRAGGVEFPRQAHLDADYDRLFPPDVAHAISYRDFAAMPTDEELLALATAAARRSTFPVSVRGRSGWGCQVLGRLGGASRSRTNASSSAGVAVPTYAAHTRWPHCSSGTP